MTLVVTFDWGGAKPSAGAWTFLNRGRALHWLCNHEAPPERFGHTWPGSLVFWHAGHVQVVFNPVDYEYQFGD